MRVFVILPAAGLGTRMAGATSQGKPIPKQFLELAGVPILIHTLQAFAQVSRVEAIYVAVRPAERERLEALLAAHAGSAPEWTGPERSDSAHLSPASLDTVFLKKVRIVEGGDTRQASMGNALRALRASATLDPQPDPGDGQSQDQDQDIVLVHDAVRPLIAPALIERTIEAVARHRAAIVALPATDTIKQVERTATGARVTATIPRECIVQAQTPQGFHLSLLERAFAEAEADGFAGTDEASLVERIGVDVAVVPGSPANIKVTQPGDLELAEFYLARATGA